MGARTYWRSPQQPLGIADGPTANTAALVDISPVPCVTLPAGYLELGTRIHAEAYGWVTSGSATPTLTMGVYMVPLNTVIGSATCSWVSPVTVQLAAATNFPWYLRWEGEVRVLSTMTTAAAATITGAGWVLMPGTTGTYAAQFAAHYPIPATYAAKTVTTAITNAAATIAIGATLSSVTGTPSVACSHLNVEVIG